MSFIVQIWEQPDGFPAPTTVEEACNLVDLAAERADPARPNARLRAFLDQVRERWPITVEPGGPRDDPAKAKVDLGVWKDDSLRRDIGDEPASTLAIDTSRIDQVLPWLAEAGPQAGVNVSDPQSGSAWLADGSVFALDDEGACAKALARLDALDDRAAWSRFVDLAQGGNLAAFGHLGRMYDEARFVGRDPAASLALRAVANGWQLVDGVATPPEGGASRASSSLEAARADAGSELCAKADALFARLRAATDLRRTLLDAAHEFDARQAAALDLIDKGEFAAAAIRIQPLANRGHVPSQRTLAHLWSTGRATPDDPRQELAWITAAAKLDDDAALQRLAWLYDEGVLRKRETRAARGVHRLLISRGRTAAIRDASRVELKRLVGPAGNPFWQGRSEPELLPLAEQGDAAAMVELARVIEWGRSLSDVWERSTPWWIRAAEAGHRDAQRKVAWLHEQGLGVAKDEAMATHWYGLAARQDDGDAQFEYARRLGVGLGIARDDAQSRQWLERAAQRRSASAMHILGKGHALGDLYQKHLLAAQLVFVLHDRMQDWGNDHFLGPDKVDPREVRRLLAEIDGGADLLEVLARIGALRPGAPPPPPPGGLSLVPMAAPAAPAAPAPVAPGPAAATRESAGVPIAARRRERVVEPEPEPEPEAERIESATPRSLAGPLLILVSLAMMAAVVSALRKDAAANVVVSWLVASAVAAAGAFRMAREDGRPGPAAALDALPMFVPFVGPALAMRTLYFRWRLLRAQ